MVAKLKKNRITLTSAIVSVITTSIAIVQTIQNNDLDTLSSLIPILVGAIVNVLIITGIVGKGWE